MRWIIRVTHQDEMALCTSCGYILNQEMLDDLPPDFRTSIFEQMVKKIEEKLKEKNT